MPIPTRVNHERYSPLKLEKGLTTSKCGITDEYYKNGGRSILEYGNTGGSGEEIYSILGKSYTKEQ